MKVKIEIIIDLKVDKDISKEANLTDFITETIYNFGDTFHTSVLQTKLIHGEIIKE